MTLQAVSDRSKKENLPADRLASSQGSTPEKLGVTALDCAAAPEVAAEEVAAICTSIALNPTMQAVPADAGAPTAVGIGTLETPSPHRHPISYKPQQGATEEPKTTSVFKAFPADSATPVSHLISLLGIHIADGYLSPTVPLRATQDMNNVTTKETNMTARESKSKLIMTMLNVNPTVNNH